MGLGTSIKSALKKTGSALHNTVGYGGQAKVGDNLFRGAEFVAKKSMKPLVKKAEDGPGWSNMYTGYKLQNKPLAVVAGAGITAYGLAAGAAGNGKLPAGSGLQGINTFAKPGQISYEGSPAVMDADGVAQTNTSAPTLGASGDLVFGLHNQRHR